MFLIDIAVPRDIEPDVSKIDHAFLYNIDDLEAVVASNLKDRQQEATRAEQIVTEEAKRFYDQLQIFQVNPTIKALHQQFREIADTEFASVFLQSSTLRSAGGSHSLYDAGDREKTAPPPHAESPLCCQRWRCRPRAIRPSLTGIVRFRCYR